MGKKKITPYAVISMILLVLVALVFIFPFYRIMTGAFNDPTNVWKAELFPSKLTMQNFVRLFKQQMIICLPARTKGTANRKTDGEARFIRQRHIRRIPAVKQALQITRSLLLT